MAAYTRVLVGTDGSDSSYIAVDRAAAIARGSDATLLVATAYRPMTQRELAVAEDELGDDAYKLAGASPAEEVLRGAVERVTAKGGSLYIDTIAAIGEPVDVLIRIAKERGVDLLVVGNRGLNTFTGRLLGSVPSVVTHRAPCDVLIVATT